LLDGLNDEGKKAQPYESAQYLMEKGAAGGRPPPAIVTQQGSTPDGPKVFGAEDKDLVAVHISSLTGEGKSFKDINDLIAKGAGDYFLGKEWTDWYLNEIQKTGLQGWLTIEQEKAFGLVPSEVPTVGVLEKGHQYTPISQLMEQGHVRSYSMLGQRGVVDLDAVRTKDATMKVLRAAKLMEKRGVDPETIEQFKYASGVDPREEANFNALVAQEFSRLKQYDDSGAILPIGARGRIVELSEAIASAEKALAAAKAEPDTATNRAAVAKAQQKLDDAKKTYEAKVQIAQFSSHEDIDENPGQRRIYKEYSETMGPLTMGTHDEARMKIGPVSGATVRLDKRPGLALAQGTVGGTDAAAVEDLEQLAAYVVHQKTRVAEAFYRRTQLGRQAKALEQTGYTGAQLDAARSYADSNFPAVEREWRGIVPDLRSDWNRKEGVVIPERARQREVELEKEKNKWYESKGYSFSVSEGRYLLTEDARLADAQADTLRKIANEQQAATEDIKRYKEGLRAMGVSTEYYGGVR
jgi:tetratricopeptide (TPR) repeat protein